MGKDITGTFKFNEDGSINLPTGDENKPAKWVKESDLLAVKGGSETKVKEWETKETSYQTQLAEANRLREESHQNLLKEQAAKEQLLSKYQDYDATKVKVGELEKTIGSHKESVTKYEKELGDRIRVALVGHGATEEQLKDKNIDQLRNLEEAAKLFNINGNKKAKYDGGGGGGTPAENPLDRAKRIIEESETRRGIVKVSNVKAAV